MEVYPTFLPNILWDLRHPPSKAKFKSGKIPSEEEWGKIILPATNFSLIYPLDTSPQNLEQACTMTLMTVEYLTQGKPVTLRDLLESIFSFYQEPITPLERRNYNFPRTYRYKLDTLADATYLFNLIQVEENKYRLQTE
jgi:hypothetical protein